MMDAASAAGRRRLMVLKDSCPCKPGCSACCSRLIYLSVAEALILYEELKQTGKWQETRERASGLVKYVKLTNPLSWFKMNFSCPILNPKTKYCSAYNVRPTLCSIHFVTSNPAVCDPWSPTSGEYLSKSMTDLHQEFERQLNRTVDGYGVMNLRVPMPVGLLFAERIQHQKGLEFGEIMGMIYNEFGGR